MQLVCENLSMQYGGKTALDSVSFTLQPGGVTGLIGPNGAGKTTLLRILATLQKPNAGRILLDGVDITKHPGTMRRALGYLPQHVPVYPNFSAREYLRYMAAMKGLPARAAKTQIDGLLESLNLADVGREPLGSFSGGMRQRVGIAAALLGDPHVLIADEPTTGLDPQQRVTLRNLLGALAMQRIVLLSTHIVSDVEAVAGQLLLLRQGRLLYTGAAAGVLQRAEGHVWEYRLPPGQLPAPGVQVSSLVQTTAGVKVRAVAPTAPVQNAVPVPARLEDACLAVLEGGVFAA